MGNLLGSPVTVKETLTGTLLPTAHDVAKELVLKYGISSMQGWRVSMEDCHIAQPTLWAERSGGVLPLEAHSLLAVFDGHGGTFAAEYGSKNMVRVLVRQEMWLEYAARWAERGQFMGHQGDRGRWQKLRERSKESDAKVGEIKEQIRRHLEGDVGTTDATDDVTLEAETTTSADSDTTDNASEMAMAAYDQELKMLLEYALKDAFCDLDAEILREVRGERLSDANLDYSRGHQHTFKHQNTPTENTHNTNSECKNSDVFMSETTKSDPPITLASLDHPPKYHSDIPTPSEDENSGTTATLVLITPQWIVCANAGDSRAIYSKSSHKAVPLSYDHKPDDTEEERRIREGGGYVSGGRVEGDLAVSRGLGDFRFKQLDVALSGARGEKRNRKNILLKSSRALSTTDDNEKVDMMSRLTEPIPLMKPGDQKVSPVPDIIFQNRNPEEDEFIVIACDGIWDVLTNQECVKLVADIFAEGESNLGLICEEVLDQCLIKGSKDNMTVIVIKFPKQIIGVGGGVIARREKRGTVQSDEEEPQNSK